MEYGHGRPLAPRLGPPPPAPEEHKKRKRAAVACKPCRERKTACNGARPACAACEARETECYYLTKDESETRLQALRRENKNLHELVEYMRTMPEDRAQSILHQLRNTENILSILRNIETGDSSSLPTSKGGVAPMALPAAPLEADFKLIVNHPIAYPALDLSRDAILAKNTLVDTSSDSANAFAYEPSSLAAVERGPSNIDTEASPGSILEEDVDDIFQAQPEPNIETDGTLPQYVDPFLGGLRIGFWTSVSVTNHFAASVISQYLETDHQVFGLFDAQLFVKDLVELRQDFCSSILVSSLLAFACQAYTSKDPEAAMLSYEFEKEAELLWRAEKKDNVLTTAGLMLLYLSYVGYGRNGEEFLQEASNMAKRLQLFGVRDSLNTEQIQSLSHGAQRALSQTAWGVFNLYILQVQDYLSLSTEYSPRVTVPSGLHIDPGDSERSKAHIIYDISRVFRHFCELSVIGSQIFLVIRDPSFRKPPPQAFALSKYNQLLALMDSLPEHMRRRPGEAAAVLVFHIRFHSIVLDLFRTFLTDERDGGYRQWYQQVDPPEAVFAASIKQLKGLSVEYASWQPTAAHSLSWHTALLYVFNAIVKNPSDPSWRFYFLLCIHAYSKLYVCYPVVEGIVQSLLAIAVKHSAISKQEARKLIQSRFYGDGAGKRAGGGMDESSEWRRRRGDESDKQGTFLIHLDLAFWDREAASVNSLTKEFEVMTVFDEFTRGIIE